MKLVAKLIIKYSNKISLLLVFFSCSKSYINYEFSLYSRSYLFSKFKLSMLESNNSNIRHYFHSKLCFLTSTNIVWFLENVLDILITIITRL